MQILLVTERQGSILDLYSTRRILGHELYQIMSVFFLYCWATFLNPSAFHLFKGFFVVLGNYDLEHSLEPFKELKLELHDCLELVLDIE